MTDTSNDTMLKIIRYLRTRIEEIDKEIENKENHKQKLEKQLKIEKDKLTTEVPND